MHEERPRVGRFFHVAVILREVAGPTPAMTPGWGGFCDFAQNDRFLLAAALHFEGRCPPGAGLTRWVTIRRGILRHNESMNVALASAFRSSSAALVATTLLLLAAPGAQAAQDVYYRCPNNVFTNTLTPKEAEAKGCKAMEAQQPTTIPAPRVRAPAAVSPGASGSRVEAQEQKARDSDARRILQDELIKAQGRMDVLQKEYNNGQPERQGDEKNYQKYLDRTADLKAQIDRTQADINAITRELAKTQ